MLQKTGIRILPFQITKDFQSLPVGTDELVLVTATDHPLANKLTVSFADIDGQDFVLSADDFDYETELSKVGDTVKQNHELLLKVQETANNRIAELKSDIEKGKKYIKEETARLQKAEQQRKEEEAKRKQELDKKKEKEKPLRGGPR